MIALTFTLSLKYLKYSALEHELIQAPMLLLKKSYKAFQTVKHIIFFSCLQPYDTTFPFYISTNQV